MILVSIYHILSTGETFKPYDFDELVNPIVKERSSSPALTDEEMINILISKGYSIQLNKHHNE